MFKLCSSDANGITNKVAPWLRASYRKVVAQVVKKFSAFTELEGSLETEPPLNQLTHILGHFP
jgi:hypothetical protein